MDDEVFPNNNVIRPDMLLKEYMKVEHIVNGQSYNFFLQPCSSSLIDYVVQYSKLSTYNLRKKTYSKFEIPIRALERIGVNKKAFKGKSWIQLPDVDSDLPRHYELGSPICTIDYGCATNPYYISTASLAYKLLYQNVLYIFIASVILIIVVSIISGFLGKKRNEYSFLVAIRIVSLIGICLLLYLAHATKDGTMKQFVMILVFLAFVIGISTLHLQNNRDYFQRKGDQLYWFSNIPVV